MRKSTKQLLTVLLSMNLIGGIGTQQVAANSLVSYSHKELTELSEIEKSELQNGKPSSIEEGDEIIYVYRPQEGCQISSSDSDKENTKVELPKTGAQADMLYALGGFTLVATVYLIARSKRGRQTFLVLIFAGGTLLGSHVVSADSMSNLYQQIQAIIQKDASANQIPQTELDCYDYIGYIQRKPKKPVIPIVPEKPEFPTQPETPPAPIPVKPSKPEPQDPKTPSVPEVKTGSLLVHYVTEDGENLSDDVLVKDQVIIGELYDVSYLKKDQIVQGGKRYQFIESKGQVSGSIEEGIQEVTFIYKELKGTIIQHFVDTTGKKLLDDVQTGEQSLDTQVQLSHPETIEYDGKKYQFISHTTEPATYQVGIQEVTYVYEIEKQQAIVTYVDVTDGKELLKESVSGLSGATMDYSTSNLIASYEDQGYKLISDEFEASDKTFDEDTSQDQTYIVELEQRVIPVTFEDPKLVPEQPVTPGERGIWPRSVETLEELIRNTTNKIQYHVLDENNVDTLRILLRTIKFSRGAKVNLVTGNIEYTNWVIQSVQDVPIEE